MYNRFYKGLFTLTEPVLQTFAGKADIPPIWITGNIRSGTTIVSQYLTGALKTAYLSNLERYYYKTPLSSAYIFRAADKYTFSTENQYGDISGPTGLSDGWEIFNRFFSYYFNPPAYHPLKPLENLLRQITGLYGKPLIIKNNANALRVFELNTLFENALFIRVNRQPIPNIYSVLNGLKAHSIANDRFWAVGPAELPQAFSFQSTLERACFQYQIVRGFLDQFGKIVGSDRFISVDYEAFCTHPEGLLNEVMHLYPAPVATRNQMLPKQFTPSLLMPDEKTTSEIIQTLAATESMAQQWIASTINRYYSEYAHD